MPADPPGASPCAGTGTGIVSCASRREAATASAGHRLDDRDRASVHPAEMTPGPVVASTPRTARTSSPSEVLHLPDRPPVLTLGPEFFRHRMRARLRDMTGRRKAAWAGPRRAFRAGRPPRPRSGGGAGAAGLPPPPEGYSGAAAHPPP